MSNESNLCWKCLNGILKLRILVPDNYSLTDFIQKSGHIKEDIVAIVKNESRQYCIQYKSGEIKSIDFDLQFGCKIKPRKSKPKANCLHYRPSRDIEGKINHIIYNKPFTKEKIEIKLKEPQQIIDLSNRFAVQSMRNLLFSI